MGVSLRKSVTLLLVLVFLTASVVTSVMPAVKEGAPTVRAQTSIATSALIHVPETAEVGQAVGVDIWIEPAPPAPAEGFHGITLKVTRPDGITDVFAPITTDSNGTRHWLYKPSQVGNFTFQFSYPGEAFADGSITYQSAQSPVATVSVLGTPRPSIEVNGGSWTQKASMQQARGGLGVATVNGKIYAIGGSTQNGSSPANILKDLVRTNEEYDPATDTWTFKKPMPTLRAAFAIAACQGKIYCIGGVVDTEKVDIVYYKYVFSAVNEVYDPETDTWETKTSMPTAAAWLTANVVDSKIHLIGGKVDYIYDPETDSWSEELMPAAARDCSVSAVVDNKMYLLSESSRRLTIYDAETNSSSQGTPSPGLAADGPAGATTGVMAPKRIYFLGVAPYVSYLDASTAPASRRANYVYDIESDSWMAGAIIPKYRFDFGVANINDKLYIVGGYILDYSSKNSLLASALNEQYTPIGYGTIPPEIAVVSPENQMYNETSVSLVFTVNKPAVWLGYSLDGQENVTITGNTTIAGLTSGLHNITVYAKDAFENIGTSETITFSIAEETEPFPTIPVAAASVVIVAVVGVGLLVYFKKRHH
jgi:hypothetical protein